MAFPHKINLREHHLRKGTPVDNDIDFSSRGTDFANMFATRMKDTNKSYMEQSPDRFDNQEANDFIATSQVLTDGIPDFADERKQVSANEFLPKYINSVFIPEEEKANSQNTLGYIQQDANSNLANNNGYAGSEGVKPT
tara:strand:+ start:332 stop:748 length:417 start_codon:yes stop_codon:yes gene_type:complete